MKQEHKDLNPTELALLTWYNPDNELYRNPEHPTIKLAGEIGELLDLYGKHKYKPGFDWMDCKNCKMDYPVHTELDGKSYCETVNGHYTPIVLDELGDIWYYLRILAWMWNIKIDEKMFSDDKLIIDTIKDMYGDVINLSKLIRKNKVRYDRSKNC